MGPNGDDTGDVDRLLRELIPDERDRDDAEVGQWQDVDGPTVVLPNKAQAAPVSEPTPAPVEPMLIDQAPVVQETAPVEPVPAPAELAPVPVESAPEPTPAPAPVEPMLIDPAPVEAIPASVEREPVSVEPELKPAIVVAQPAPAPQPSIDGQEPALSRSRWVVPTLLAAGVLLIVGLAVGYLISGRDTGGSTGVAGDIDAAGPASSTTVDPTTTTAGEPTSTTASIGFTDALQERLASTATSGVWFVEGSDELTDGGRDAISELAAALNGEPGVPLVVDVASFGPASVDDLGVRQAESIVAALVAEGVDPSRLAATGRASERPPATADVLVFETDDATLASELGAAALTVDALADDDGLSAAAVANLDALGAAMANNPSADVLIAGHVDAGSSEASHDRSHLIVDQAAAYLGEIGVDADRVRAVGRSQAPVEVSSGSSVDLLVGSSAAVVVANNRFTNAPDLFAAGTADLTPAGRTLVADVAATLAANPPSAMEVVAYAFTEASDEGNHDLSHDQGQVVADLLVEAGLSPEQLSITGKGDDAELAGSGRTSHIVFQAED